MTLTDYQKANFKEHTHTQDQVFDDTGAPIVTGGGAASGVTFAPAGNLSSTDVQAALQELDTEKATPAQVTAAVNAVIASAPAALDTLNELAAALGNDANYAATITTALAGKQPLDSDLTAIAALSTTSYGRAFLALADAAAGRTALGLGSAATTASSAYEVAGAAAAAQAASQPVDSDLTAIAALTTTSFGRSLLTASASGALAVGQITITLDGAGSVLTTGAKTEFRVPYGVTITGWEILADVSGSIVFDIWKDVYANYPPDVADTITASAKPTLSSATKATSSTLTGWTTAWSAGDIVKVNVDSVATVTRAHLILNYTRGI